MKIVDWQEAGAKTRAEALARPSRRTDTALRDEVEAIIAAGRDGGWDVLCALAERIDGSPPESVQVAPFAAEARKSLSSEALDALDLARRNIETFHREARPRDISVAPLPGLTVRKNYVPISHAGLYIPGGKAPLFSTLMMLAIPANVAGVGKLTVVTPPREDGGLDPVIALAADMCGIEEIWTVGGAQAIAALAFGAGAIEKADIICGPGNAWVATAKALVSALPGGPAIDVPAGPSELMVIADDTVDPRTVAADLLSQAEHDADAQAILCSTSPDLINRVATELRSQQQSMGGDFAEVRAIQCADLDQALAIANNYAPEHLSLACSGASALAERVTNAGTIFVGGSAAETFGDYLAGPSHVLPTDGAARHSGGVTTATFMKPVGIQTISDDCAARLAGPAAILARLEGLEAHARAADARAERLAEAAE